MFALAGRRSPYGSSISIEYDMDGNEGVVGMVTTTGSALRSRKLLA
jgi:hypothetical protein